MYTLHTIFLGKRCAFIAFCAVCVGCALIFYSIVVGLVVFRLLLNIYSCVSFYCPICVCVYFNMRHLVVTPFLSPCWPSWPYWPCWVYRPLFFLEPLSLAYLVPLGPFVPIYFHDELGPLAPPWPPHSHCPPVSSPFLLLGGRSNSTNLGNLIHSLTASHKLN